MNKYINERLHGYFPITETQRRMAEEAYKHGTTHATHTASKVVSQLTSSTRLEDDDTIYRTAKEL